MGITYTADRPYVLMGYSDSDGAGNMTDQKSTSGFVFLPGGGAISWKSKKQTIVVLSTIEVEYISASEASREALWL